MPGPLFVNDTIEGPQTPMAGLRLEDRRATVTDVASFRSRVSLREKISAAGGQNHVINTHKNRHGDHRGHCSESTMMGYVYYCALGVIWVSDVRPPDHYRPVGKAMT